MLQPFFNGKNKTLFLSLISFVFILVVSFSGQAQSNLPNEIVVYQTPQ